MVTFEDVMEEIKPIAKNIAYKSKQSMEYDELINDAWLINKGKSQPTKGRMKQRIKWDMLDALRRKTGFRKQKNGKMVHTPWMITNYGKNSDTSENQNDDYVSYFFDIPVEDKSLLNLENQEIIDKLLKAPNENQVKLIKKFYLESKLLREIGEETGTKDCTLSSIIKRGIEKCKKRAKFLKLI